MKCENSKCALNEGKNCFLSIRDCKLREEDSVTKMALNLKKPVGSIACPECGKVSTGVLTNKCPFCGKFYWHYKKNVRKFDPTKSHPYKPNPKRSY